MPVLAGAPHADRTAVLGCVGNDDDLRAARHAPSFAEDVELDIAKAPGELDLSRRCDGLVAEKDDAVLVIGPLDRGEAGVIERPRQIDSADFGTDRGPGRD